MDPYSPPGELRALRHGLSGISRLRLEWGEMAPGRNGAGISESMLAISSSPSVRDASVASCSHDKMDPRPADAPWPAG
jgi:hypothetical protein